ncbi:peptidoglycan amidohydrolase family protein [Anaerococcus sp. AGMB09787]|uniref:peptidoglycan amidohydrolase family protein n=1 Tax=Anaerococcus sp. AGMB09787 TaxID=2922869 RepID=UPI001FAF3B79|nr:peptidoglycan amidohydrolase family protein [Anaerococcus sp. AGMB09787]
MGVKEAIKWFDDRHRSKGKHHYSMVNRYGNPDYDCSSAVHYALIAGGVLPSNIRIGNTEDLFAMNGKYLDEVYSYRDVQAGDIFIRGGEGTSLGAAGHTGMFYKKDGIVHCNYSNNGISYNDRTSYVDYFLDMNRSWNERCFRPRYGGRKTTTSKPKSTSNKARKIKNENWHGVTMAVCNVRSEPSTSAPIVAQYRPQQTINYDSVYEGDGYRWISYISYSGARRYVAYRSLATPSDQWIDF